MAVAPAPAPAAAAAGRASASASGVRANAPPARRDASAAACRAGRLGRDAPAPLARRAASLVARSSSAEAERGTAPTEGDAPATDRVVRLAFSMPDWTGEGEALVVGSAPALGDWDPDVGLELRGCQRDPSGAPDAWTGLVKLPAGAEGEYKVVIRARDAVDRWSPDENRILPVDASLGADEPFQSESYASFSFEARTNDGAENLAVATRRAHDGSTSARLARVSFDDVLPREKPDAVLATVVFRAEASLRVGQRLVVAGNCPELGYWRPKDSAATMAWSEGDRWTAAVKFDAFAVFGAVDATSAAGWLDFKLVIVDDARDGAETWLDGDNFRVRRLPGPDAVAALNDWLSGEHYAATLGTPSADGAGARELPGADANAAPRPGPRGRFRGDRRRGERDDPDPERGLRAAVDDSRRLGEDPERDPEPKEEETPRPPTPRPRKPPKTSRKPRGGARAAQERRTRNARHRRAGARGARQRGDAALLSKAARALESAAAAADESALLDKAERVLADAAATATEAAREMRAPGVTLSFVRDPEDQARLAARAARVRRGHRSSPSRRRPRRRRRRRRPRRRRRTAAAR